jgi:predicted ATPase/DNA-binding SARP family transcriptional activator
MAGIAEPAAGALVRFRVLGPVAVLDAGGRPLPLGPPRHRTLLAALLVHPGTLLPTDRLTDLLWEGAAPATASTIVHGAVSGLRRVLGPVRDQGDGRLVTRDGGYVLDVDRGRIDVGRFTALLARGRGLVTTAPEQASRLLAEALALWRGPALDGIGNDFARVAAAGWDELRLDCQEAWIAAELGLGHHPDVVARLEQLVAAHPYRERLCAQLVLALYRCGRQADALRTLRVARRTLAGELGLEPGPDLRRLERAVLEQRADLLPDRRPGGARGGASLPAPLSSFVGRVRECTEVAALLAASRLVTLVGTGGAGKTRLAVEVSRRRAADGPAETWLVDLTPLATPELVGETVAAALGVRTVPGRPLVDTLADALAGRDGLLVLDNCEHLVDACAAFATALLDAAPQVRLLTTSREALRVPGEQVHVVRPMAVAAATDSWDTIAGSDAVRLFASRAAAARPGFAVTRENAGLVLELCRRLDGLPLALELAAARAASVPLPELVRRLDDRFRLLDSAVRPAGARARGLAATLAWSVDRLSAPERLLFARISVFPASFSLAAAEAVAGDGDLAGRDLAVLLAGLVAVSTVLLEEGPDGHARYRLLETTRQYGRERLDGDQTAALRQRHAQHVLSLAQAAAPHLHGPASAPWLAELSREQDDVRTALEWSLGPDGDPLVGARLISCLWHLWDLRGTRSEGAHWVHAALRAITAEGVPERLPLLSAGALFHLGRAEFAEVADLAGEQLRLARATGARRWEGDALSTAATVAWARGRFDDAQRLYEDAVAASLDGGDRWRAALAEAQLARLHRDRDEPDAARSAVLRALRHAEEVGEELALGLALDVLASIEHRWGDAAEAGQLTDEALGHYRAVGYREGEASALQLAGRIALSAGRPEDAAACFERSLALCRAIGHRAGSASAIEGLAAVAAVADDDEGAALLLGASAALRRECGTPLPGWALADDVRDRARVAERLGRGTAERLFRRGAGLGLEVLTGAGRTAPAPRERT